MGNFLAFKGKMHLVVFLSPSQLFASADDSDNVINFKTKV